MTFDDRLRRAIERGLSADRTERYPSMAALLQAIARHQRRARTKRWLGAGLGAIAIVGLALGGVIRARQAKAVACAEQGETAAAIWPE